MPQYRDHVETGTAVGIYAATAAVSAIGAPLAAWALDDRGEFPLVAALGTSLATGFVGFAIASVASIAFDEANECGPSELYAERVLLLDLVPLTLAAAPTLIAWQLSDASTEAAPESARARLSLGAVADPRAHVLVFGRLEL